MLRWLWPCLALVVAAAIALWLAAQVPRVVAPRLSHEAAPAIPPDVARHHAQSERGPVLVESDDRRAAETAPIEVLQELRDLTPAGELVTRLSVLVLEPDGRPWMRGRLRLEVHELVGDASMDWVGRQPLTGTQSIRPREVRSIRARFTDWITDGEGRAELPGIPPGHAFEVQAVDAYGRSGGSHAGAAFAAGEVRDIEIRLARTPSAVAGRCFDASGTPLERVSIGIGGPARELWTDAQGRFATPPLFGEDLVLHCALRGFVSRRELLTLPSEAPLEIVLERARRLSVLLVDESGESFTLHGLQARDLEGGPEVDTYPEVRDGAHVFESMPRVPVTLEIVGCGASPTCAVDALAEEVRWSLPRPGELVVEVDPRRTDLPRGLVVELRLPDSAEPLLEQRMGIGQLQIPQRWSLFPGRYVVQFHAWTDPAPATPYGPPHEFEIRAGEVTVVPLGD